TCRGTAGTTSTSTATDDARPHRRRAVRGVGGTAGGNGYRHRLRAAGRARSPAATTTEERPMNATMRTPPIVSADEWEAARQELLVKEKALTRARDAL